MVEKNLLHSQPAGDPELKEKIDRIRKTIDEVPEQPIKVFEAFNRGIFNQNRFNNLRKDKYFQEAVFQLKNSAKIATPSHIDALVQLAFLYILKWETSSSPRWLEKSEEKWNEIRKKKPNNPFALVELAYVSLVSRKHHPPAQGCTLVKRTLWSVFHLTLCSCRRGRIVSRMKARRGFGL